MELQQCLLTAQMILENRAARMDFANAYVSLRRIFRVHLELLMTNKNASRSTMNPIIGSLDTNHLPISERRVRFRVKHESTLFNTAINDLAGSDCWWTIIEYNLDTSSRGTYKTPSHLCDSHWCGWCGLHAQGGRHEHCRCSKPTETIEQCKNRCDYDRECKGYSFRGSNSRCYLYTTSTCPGNCYKRSPGNVGNLIEMKDPTESGCFIKQQGKSNRNV